MTKRSNNRPLRALISLLRSDQEPLQHHAIQIAALVAAALFMENLDSTIIVTALPQMAQSFGASPLRFEHRRNRLHAHSGRRHSDRRLDGGLLRRTARVRNRDRDYSPAPRCWAGSARGYGALLPAGSCKALVAR
jgi:hypothetical protein